MTAFLPTLILLAFLSYPARAFAQTPPPPTVNLDAPRFDSGRNLYLLDMVFTRPEAIGVLQISLVGPEGVEVQRLSATPTGRNQTVELDASALQAGLVYRIEVKGFDPGGAPIIAGQNSGGDNLLLAVREFTHLPGQAHLGELRFTVDAARQQLSIEVPVNNSQSIAGYRVLLEDQATRAVSLDVRLPAPPPLKVSLAGLPAGEYQVTVVALDAAGQPLTQADHPFTYSTQAAELGTPLFEYQDNPPALLVRLQPVQAQAITGYHILLIDKATNQIALEHASGGQAARVGGGLPNTGAAAPFDPAVAVVPLGGLRAGEYNVLVKALDATGQELASAQGETTYVPPAPPSTLARLRSGLLANPLIPLLIVLVLVMAAGVFGVYSLVEKRSTATPMLQGWGRSDGKRETPELSHTLALPGTAGPNATPELFPQTAAPQMLLRIASTPDRSWKGKVLRIRAFPFTIGRSGCDLSLPGDEHISRKHAELHFNGGGLYIVDRLSSNGTFVNGERIAADRPVPLDPARRNHIRLGRETQLWLELAPEKGSHR